MKDSESGYRAFIRVAAGLVFAVCFFQASSYLLISTMVQSHAVDVQEFRDLLEFWILIIVATYALMAFCLGQILWPFGSKPSLARILVVTLVVAIILALLAPLIRKSWFDSSFSNPDIQSTVIVPAT